MSLLAGIIARWTGGRRSSATRPVVYLGIFTGQSLMVSQLGQIGDTVDAPAALPLAWRGAQSNIKIWYKGDFDTPVAGHFESMLVPVNTRDASYTDPGGQAYPITGYGVEQSVMHNLQTREGRTVYAVKEALGSLNITNWLPPTGTMWEKLAESVPAAINYLEGQGYAVHPFVNWMQGESDVLESIDASYQARLITFEEAFRGLHSVLADCPIVYSKLSAGQTALNNTRRLNVNAAFDHMEANYPNNYSMDADIGTPLIFQVDHLHETPAGVLIRSEKFWSYMTDNDLI